MKKLFLITIGAILALVSFHTFTSGVPAWAEEAVAAPPTEPAGGNVGGGTDGEDAQPPSNGNTQTNPAAVTSTGGDGSPVGPKVSSKLKSLWDKIGADAPPATTPSN